MSLFYNTHKPAPSLDFQHVKWVRYSTVVSDFILVSEHLFSWLNNSKLQKPEKDLKQIKSCVTFLDIASFTIIHFIITHHQPYYPPCLPLLCYLITE